LFQICRSVDVYFQFVLLLCMSVIGLALHVYVVWMTCARCAMCNLWG
jgi:hypothetical protein